MAKKADDDEKLSYFFTEDTLGLVDLPVRCLGPAKIWPVIRIR